MGSVSISLWSGMYVGLFQYEYAIYQYQKCSYSSLKNCLFMI